MVLNNSPIAKKVNDLKEKDFFMKWSGEWPALARVKSWCMKQWGLDIFIRSLSNGFYQVECTSRGEKHQIMNQGPYMTGIQGLFKKD